MFCHECGKQNPDYAKFCAFCGTRLVEPEPAPEQDLEQPDPAPAEAPAEPPQQPAAPKPIKLKPDVIKLDPHQVFKRPPDASTVRPLELNPAQPGRGVRAPEPAAQPEPPAEQDPPIAKPERVSERTGRQPIGVVTASGSRMEPPARPANVKKGAPSHREPQPSPYRQAQERRAKRIAQPEDDLFFEDIDPDEAFDPEEEDGIAKKLKAAIAVVFLAGVVLALGWLFMTPGGETFRASMGMNAPAEAFKRLGDEAYAQGKLESAVGYYHKALVRDGENYDYAMRVGMTAAEKGDAETAGKAFKLCMQLKPGAPDPYRLMAEMNEQRGDADAGEQWRRQGYSLTGDEALIASLPTPEPTATPEPTRDVPNFSDIQDFVPVN